MDPHEHQGDLWHPDCRLAGVESQDDVSEQIPWPDRCHPAVPFSTTDVQPEALRRGDPAPLDLSAVAVLWIHGNRVARRWKDPGNHCHGPCHGKVQHPQGRPRQGPLMAASEVARQFSSACSRDWRCYLSGRPDPRKDLTSPTSSRSCAPKKTKLVPAGTMM